MNKTIITNKSEITHYPDRVFIRSKCSGAGAPPMGQITVHSPNPTHARKQSDPPAAASSTSDALMRQDLRRQLGLDTIGKTNK